MPTNNREPNSTADIEKVSRSVDYVLDNLQTPGSIQSMLNVLTVSLERQGGPQIRPMLNEMVQNVDRPILKNMAQDVVTVLSNWFEDPQVLCCIVQGLFTMFNATAFWTEDNVNLGETEFAQWLDLIIAFVDVIIVLLGSNIKKLSIAIPDFIKEIMNGVVGAVLLVMQELLFAIRDSILNTLLDELTRSQRRADGWWARCLPLVELIEILRKYISDYGLFAELFEKIKGYIGGMVGSWNFYKGLDFPQNVKDLEFLYWFRDLLVKLKHAALAFDLCFLPQATQSSAELRNIGAGGGINVKANAEAEIPGAPTGTQKRRSNPDEIQGITLTSDRTILGDKESLRKGGTLPILTNSSVRGFLNKYYGYPLDVVDTLLVGSSSADSIQGTDTGGNLDVNADCPNSPTPAEAVQWALRVRNRNL